MDDWDEQVSERMQRLLAEDLIAILQTALEKGDAMGALESIFNDDELSSSLEDFRSDAEEEVREANPLPCCKDYHCPCGG